MKALGALSKIPKKQKTILYIVGFVISAVILVQLILIPILGKMKELDAKIEKEERRIKANLNTLARKAILRKEIDYFGSFVTQARSQEEETVSFLQEIEEMANKSSLYVIDIKSAGLEKGEALEKYLVKLNCEAQIEQITNFFYDVESSKKLYKVESYDIRPKTAGSSVIRCAVSISKALMAQEAEKNDD